MLKKILKVVAALLIVMAVVVVVDTVWVRDSHNCNDSSYEVGLLVSIDLIPTSFNEAIKTRLETTTHIFIIRGPVSGQKDVVVWQCSKCWSISPAGYTWRKLY